MRNPNPFTVRQVRLLEAIRERVNQIEDPEPEVIWNESFEWREETTRQFGRIPKVRFRPHSGQIKAELVRQAGLVDADREKEIERLREKFGIRAARNKEARLFEAEWNNIMFKIKKAMFTVGFINQLFTSLDQSVSEPIRLLQDIVLDEFCTQIKPKRKPVSSSEAPKSAETIKNKGIKPYDEELAQLE